MTLEENNIIGRNQSSEYLEGKKEREESWRCEMKTAGQSLIQVAGLHYPQPDTDLLGATKCCDGGGACTLMAITFHASLVRAHPSYFILK